MMESDWKELIELFQSHGVEFLVVGAHALGFLADRDIPRTSVYFCE